MDIRRSGESLVEFFRANEGTSSASKWDIVCHSQGGLVLMWASILAGKRRFARWVRRVVFVGVPVMGTVNAAAALLEGVDMIEGVRVDVSTVRTWPSVYMMLPRWWVGISRARTQEVLLNATWNRAGLLRSATNPNFDLQVDPTLLARARAWHRALRHETFEALRQLPWLVIQGHNLPTRLRTPEFPRLPSLRHVNGDTVANGDGLVPADQTWSMLPRQVRYHVETLYRPVRSHMAMCTQAQTLQLVEGFFR
jgi:pimeloyl-ACP methyl ester carboxylesterase